ncbi:50S ribosomal protein L29 [Candidatus Peregrinibacteria bacterium]|nr:MAG: 50S ribosomal protein L29 [Candidatus Peregrinibacteria bacterium]
MTNQAKPIDELKKELAHLRVDLKTGKSKQSHKVKDLKRQIARIHTFNKQSSPNN